MKAWTRPCGWCLGVTLALTMACDSGDDSEPEEQQLGPEDDAANGKTDEAQYDPTTMCLDNGSIPNGPNVGPAALGDTVLGTSGRADGFGSESWGAEYGAELSLKGVTGGPHGTETLVRGELVGRATLYDLSADVLRIVLDGRSAADGEAGFDANLTILDRFTYPLFSYEGNFSDEQNFSAPLFTATTGVPLVPGLAPVEVNAQAVGSLGYLVSGQILPKGVAILVRPEASVLVTATASAGIGGIASARVDGQMELITLSVPIQAALTFDEDAGLKFTWDVRVDLDADWLAGEIEVIVSALGEDRYRKTLASWEGFHIATTHMSDGAGEIFPGKPGDCVPSQLQRGDDELDRIAAVADPQGQTEGAMAGLLDAAPILAMAAAPDVVTATGTMVDLAAAAAADPDTAQRVAGHVDDDDPWGAVMAGALAQAGTTDAQTQLLGVARDEAAHDRGRIRALASLGRVSSPSGETVAGLQVVYASSRGDVRTAAGYALGNALAASRPYDPEGTDAAIMQLEYAMVDATGDEKVELLRILGNIGADRSLPVLAVALRDGSDAVRVAAAHALRRVPGHTAMETLRSVMHDDESPSVREAAVRAAGSRDTERAYEAIADLVQREPDGWVQVAALHALGRAVVRSEEAPRGLRVIAEHGLPQLQAVARNYLHRVEAEANAD